MEKFKIGDIFTIIKGKRLTQASMIPGEYNFIGATSMKNEITTKIGNDKYLHQGNVITVTYNGSVGESFYQVSPFWASDDVNVLYYRGELNENLALFFLAPLMKRGKTYEYSFKWTKDKMEEDYIYLPSIDGNKIDIGIINNLISAIKKIKAEKIIKYFENVSAEPIVDKSFVRFAAEPFEVISINDLYSINADNFYFHYLIGYYKNQEHLDWILKNQLYNIPLDNRHGSANSRKIFKEAEVLILYGPKKEGELRIFKLQNPTERTGKELNDNGYPDAKEENLYGIYEIEEIDEPIENYKTTFEEVKEKLGRRLRKPVFIKYY